MKKLHRRIKLLKIIERSTCGALNFSLEWQEKPDPGYSYGVGAVRLLPHQPNTRDRLRAPAESQMG